MITYTKAAKSLQFRGVLILTGASAPFTGADHMLRAKVWAAPIGSDLAQDILRGWPEDSCLDDDRPERRPKRVARLSLVGDGATAEIGMPGDPGEWTHVLATTGAVEDATRRLGLDI